MDSVIDSKEIELEMSFIEGCKFSRRRFLIKMHN